MITDYLKFLRFFGSILLVYLIYFSAYFVSQKYLAVLFCSLAIVGFDTCIIGGKAKEIEGKYFLTLETLNPTLYFLSVSGYEYYYSIERRIATTSMVSIVLLLYLGIRNVIFNYGNSSSKKTIENVKKKYQLT
jgi:hypothetical protein